MIPIIVGIIFVLGVVAFLYYLKYRRNNENFAPPESNEKVQDPKKEDIVLASITPEYLGDNNTPPTYAILWNGTPNNKYYYTITNLTNGTNGTDVVIAKGEVIAPASGLVKIKEVPLVEHSQYQVHVNETSINVYFEPPKILLPLKIDSNNIECNTNVVPTGIEVLLSGKKIDLKYCQIKIDPDDPGFMCDTTQTSPVVGEVTVMAYNGPNVVNILGKC